MHFQCGSYGIQDSLAGITLDHEIDYTRKPRVKTVVHMSKLSLRSELFLIYTHRTSNLKVRSLNSSVEDISSGGMNSMIPKKILFATDFSENSAQARQCAIDYANAFAAELIVIHVINSSTIGYPSLERGVPVDIRSALEAIQESVDKALQLLLAECSVSVGKVQTFSRIGVPAYEIVRFAKGNSVDLIVTGTHGWTGFKHLILGSTAENVVRSAYCPVLTVRSFKSA